jgi:nucleoside-diphosphate-sugar epimerase
MKILITGACGFVGRALARRLLGGTMEFERLTLLDVLATKASEDTRLRIVGGSIADGSVRARALEGGVNVIFHLAGVLSAVSESDYALSRRVNLDATLDLFEEAAQAARSPRVVFTSSVAVFGESMPARVDDDTPPTPTLTYGAHKRMCEIALADLSRKGALVGISVRLPGIVARPFGGTTTKSAFMSDIFHAFARGEPFTSPVPPEATFWLLSLARCIDNLIHAARMPVDGVPPSRAVTLPALRLSVPDLADSLVRTTRRRANLVSYVPEAGIEAVFGRYPELSTALAGRLGFRNDGNVDALVETVLRELDSV